MVIITIKSHFLLFSLKLYSRLKFTIYETWACCIPFLEARLLLMNTTIKVVSKVNRTAARIVPIRTELLPLSVLIGVTEFETVNVISSVVSMFVAVEVTWPMPKIYHRVFSIIWIWMTQRTSHYALVYHARFLFVYTKMIGILLCLVLVQPWITGNRPDMT